MELFIKVYETCPACKGTGWVEVVKEDGGTDCVLCPNCPIASGKVERIIKIEELIDNIKDYFK